MRWKKMRREGDGLEFLSQLERTALRSFSLSEKSAIIKLLATSLVFIW